MSYLQWADGFNNDVQTVQKLQLSGSFWLINNERYYWSMWYVYETAHSHLLNKIITCYNKLIEQCHLMKTSSMPSKYGIQEQNGTNDQWALSSPFCPHILKQKGCLHHPFDCVRVQSRSTRWYNFRRWSLAREWNLELFLQPLLLLSCRNHPTFFVCVTTLLSQGRTGSKICSALYHSITMECMCMWDEKKSKKYTNKHIHLYI